MTDHRIRIPAILSVSPVACVTDNLPSIGKSAPDKGKPVARPSRKATGPRNEKRNAKSADSVIRHSLFVIRLAGLPKGRNSRTSFTPTPSFAIDKGKPVRKPGTQSRRPSRRTNDRLRMTNPWFRISFFVFRFSNGGWVTEFATITKEKIRE